MSDELHIAVKCHDSRQRPALKRKCSKCVVTGNAKNHLGPSTGGGGHERDIVCHNPDCAGGAKCDLLVNDGLHCAHHGGCGHMEPNTYVPGLPDPSEMYHLSCSHGVGALLAPPPPPHSHLSHHHQASHHS